MSLRDFYLATFRVYRDLAEVVIGTVALAHGSYRLCCQVTSTNWRDDYLYKLAEYELLGIAEYWIVDYLAPGAARYIGSPKTPTVSIYSLVGEEYQLQQFRGDDLIRSRTFLDLQLSARSIFDAVGG